MVGFGKSLSLRHIPKTPVDQDLRGFFISGLYVALRISLGVAPLNPHSSQQSSLRWLWSTVRVPSGAPIGNGAGGGIEALAN